MNPYLPVTEYPHSEYPDFDYLRSQHAQGPLSFLGSFPSECPLAPHQIARIQQSMLSSGVHSLPSQPSLQLEPGSLSEHGSSARETSPSPGQSNQSQDHDDSEAEGEMTVEEKRRRNTVASGKWLLDILD